MIPKGLYVFFYFKYNMSTAHYIISKRFVCFLYSKYNLHDLYILRFQTQLFGNIENKKNTIEKMEHPAKKKENYNSYDDCTTSIRPVIESKITEKKSSANMEDARSKGDCCMTTVPRPESSSAFSKDVNDVSEIPVDTFKTANASTTAIIKETKHVNSKPMVSGGLTGGIQQGLRTRNNHGNKA